MTHTSHAEGRPSLGELVARLTDQLRSLIRDEIALAKAQLARKIQQTMIGVAAFAVAGLLAVMALGVLVAAAVLGLAEVLPAWLAALCVAAALLLLGVVAALLGKRALAAPAPDPAATIRLDIDAVRQGVQQ